MTLYWHVFVVVATATILIKENFCVPAIRPLSQRGILFPVDNWDDCYLDNESTLPGVCKSLEECSEVLKKWDTENIYPKTCYFIKKEQFVCCPKDATTTARNPNINTETPTKKPGNIFLDIFNTDPATFTTQSNPINGIPTKRPSNIFLDNSNTPSTKKPYNIFLDNLKTNETETETSTKKPDKSPSSNPIPDIFNTEKPFNLKRRSDTECDLQNQNNFKITVVNGQPSKPNEFPFMAALGWKSNSDDKIWYPCGGVLISSRFVLTAAHCAELGGESPSFVRLGGKNLTESKEGNIKIKQFIKYPGYNVTTIYNDIALVELEQEVNNPMACLWSLHDLPITKVTALGYGHTRFGGLGSNQLLKAPLTIVGKTECQQFYKLDDKLQTMDIVDTHLCAGDTEHFRDTCQGDSGGPLIMKIDQISYVVGITSFGLGCAGLPPSIYTRVSSFIDWMEQIIWPEIDVRFNRK